MNRAERRRMEREKERARTATYNLTQEQLDAMIQQKIGSELNRIKQEATEKAINTAMVLLLTLPLEVLMDFYWKKSYAKRIPEFTQHVLDYYEMWQNDELDIEDLKKDLWEFAGVKIGEED